MNDTEATSNGTSESVPDPGDLIFLGPISATPLTSSVHAIHCKEKALLEVSLALNSAGKQTRVLFKIDSGAETKLIPTSHLLIQLWLKASPMARFAYALTPMTLIPPSGVPLTV